MTDPNWNWGDTLDSKQNSFKNMDQSNAPFPNQEWQQWNETPEIQASDANSFSSPQYLNHLDNSNDKGLLHRDYGNFSLATKQAPQASYNKFPQQIVSDPFLNTARQIGGQFAEQQREKFAKYLSSFHLKYYFAVDTCYVGKKLGIIIFPFIHRDWTNKFGQGGEPMAAKDDLNAPDLYIPLMAFITYVLVAGFVFGLQKRFSPEKLGMLTTNALFYLFLENILVFVTKYVLNISQSLNVWHALSYSSYKFVGMVICLLLYLVGGSSIYYIGLAYCIFTTVFFLLRSLKTFILDVGNENYGGRKRKLYLLLSITALQSVIMWLLTSSVTSYMPDHYNFAKLAIGLAKSGAGSIPKIDDNNAFIQANKEVDYEALLNMP